VADDVRTFETGFERQEGQRPSRMDVIPAGPMRRRWSAEAKARIIASSFEPGANIAEIARTHGGTDPPAVVYTYMPGRGKVWAEKLLGEFTGIVQCDGYGAYICR